MGLENIIGYAAVAVGLVTFLPQVIKTWRTKQTKDISFAMYFILWLGVILWLAYGIFIRKPPLIIINIIVVILVSIMLILKIKYK